MDDLSSLYEEEEEEGEVDNKEEEGEEEETWGEVAGVEEGEILGEGEGVVLVDGFFFRPLFFFGTSSTFIVSLIGLID